MSERTDPNIRRPTGPIEVVSEERADGSFEIKLEAKAEGKDSRTEEAVAGPEAAPAARRAASGEGGGVAAYAGLLLVLGLLGAGAYLLFVSPHHSEHEPPLVGPQPAAPANGEGVIEPANGGGGSSGRTLERAHTLRTRDVNAQSLRRAVIGGPEQGGEDREGGPEEDRGDRRLLRHRLDGAHVVGEGRALGDRPRARIRTGRASETGLTPARQLELPPGAAESGEASPDAPPQSPGPDGATTDGAEPNGVLGTESRALRGNPLTEDGNALLQEGESAVDPDAGGSYGEGDTGAPDANR